VSKVPEAEALEDSYGPKPPGERDEASTVPAEASPKDASCAYMLVYIRERDRPMVMRELGFDTAPQQHRESCHCQHREDPRAEPEPEASLHATAELLTVKDVANFSWYTAATDFAPLLKELMAFDDMALHHAPPAVQVEKSEPVAAVMLHVRRELGIPLYRQQLWVIARRQNKMWRVSQPLCRLRPPSARPHEEGEAFLDSQAKDLMEEGQLLIYVEELPELREVPT
jgi:hypothetical protein